MNQWARRPSGRMWHSEDHRRELRTAQREGFDAHTWVASWYYGVPYDRVTREQRAFAKEQNYYQLYCERAR